MGRPGIDSWRLRDERCYSQVSPVLGPQQPRLLPEDTLQVITEEPAPRVSRVSPGSISVVWFSLRNPQAVALQTQPTLRVHVMSLGQMYEFHARA